MTIDPWANPDEQVAREVLKPLEEVLSRADEELKQIDEKIHEAERKSKAVLDPEL